jgi:dTDP-4-amino-4,6-dideoxygalactose transaminase
MRCAPLARKWPHGRNRTQLSEYLDGSVVRALTSATEGLEIALLAAGIGPGDEVITPAMSFCATANTILRVGARPVFVDVDLDSRNLLLDAAEAAITPRTGPSCRSTSPVCHSISTRYTSWRRNTTCASSKTPRTPSTSWRGKRIGSCGDLVCFSFHPNKNMTTGEGGAIATRRNEDVQFIERARFHGIERGPPGEMDVMFAGMKANMSDIAACIGLGQLARLDEFNARRRQLVDRYFELWSHDCPVRLPARGDEGHSWHMFAPLLPLADAGMTRAEFIRRMDELGISVGVHYPAIHLFSAYRKLGWKQGMFPNAERIGRDGDIAAVPGHARHRCGSGRWRGERGAESYRVKPHVSIVIPVFNEGVGLPLLFARLFPALDALGKPWKWSSSMTAAATIRWHCCAKR